MQCAGYVNCCLAVLSVCFLSIWSLIIWAPLIFVSFKFNKADIDQATNDLKNPSKMYIYAYKCLALVQLVWIFLCIFSNFFVMIVVNATQVFILWGIREKI